MQTCEPPIDAATAAVIRKARNRLRSIGPRFRTVVVPDDPNFVAFLARANGVACWFHGQREPKLHELAAQFESAFESEEARAAAIADALRVW